MALGLSTAPVLFGAEQQPELKLLIARKFGAAGDVARACELVLSSDGLMRTKELATCAPTTPRSYPRAGRPTAPSCGRYHAQAAVDACCSLPEGQERDGLIRLCHVVLSRSS